MSLAEYEESGLLDTDEVAHSRELSLPLCFNLATPTAGVVGAGLTLVLKLRAGHPGHQQDGGRQSQS